MRTNQPAMSGYAALLTSVRRLASSPWTWVVLALAMRLWGLSSGLPDAPHPDETPMIQRALRFGSGDFNPHWFYYPSLLMYLVFVIEAVFFAGGRLLGSFHSSHDFALLYVRDPTAFYVAARALVALSDAASAGLVAQLARRHFGNTAAAVAGLLWMIYPAALGLAQVAKPDSLMVCLALAGFVILRDGSRPGRCALAGLVLGLAASAKYNAALLVPAALLTIALSPSRQGWPLRVIALAAVSGVGFLAGTPFALLDSPTFWHDFRDQSGFMRAGLTGTHDSPLALFYYLKCLADPAGPLILVLLASLGVWYARRQLRSREATFHAFAFASVLLGMAGQRMVRDTYLLPAFPFLFVLAGAGVAAIRHRAGMLGRAAAVVVVFAAAAPWAWTTASHLWTIKGDDSRIVAHRWIDANIPEGSRILTDGSGPALQRSRGQLESLLDRARRAGHVKSDLFALQLEAHTGGGYELFLAEQPVMATPPELLAYSRQVQDLVPIDEGIEGMRRRGIGYVVTASASDDTMSGSQVQFHAELGHVAGQLAEFTGGPWVRPGPTVRVYRIAPAGQSNPATASSLSNPKTVTPSASTPAPNP